MKKANAGKCVANGLIGLMFLAGFGYGEAQPAGTGAQAPEQLSQLVDPMGLEDPLLRWNAVLVSPQGKPAEGQVGGDYAETVLKNAWDFNEGDFDGITRFSDGIVEPRVKDGKLAFTVGDKPFFYWGDHFDDPGVKGLHLGEDWRSTTVTTWKMWAITIRLKQSLPESEWTISARQAGSPPGMDKKTVTVKGTNWQEVTVSFRRGGSGFSDGAMRRHSLCVEPAGKGNAVEIDWVKAGPVDPPACVRTRLAIEKKPISAQFCFLPEANCRLYINGKKVETSCNPLTAPVEAADHIQPGATVIAIESDAEYRGLVKVALEGCLIFKDGSFRRIFTDANWKGSYARAEHWEQPDFDDSAWEKVKTWDNVAKSMFTIQRYQDKNDGRNRANGFGIFLDPPYFGPIGLNYPDITGPADIPPFFPVAQGANVRLTLPVCDPPATYEMSYTLHDAFTGRRAAAGALKESGVGNGRHVFDLAVKQPEPGVYNLTVEARKNGVLLDRRFEEIALIGRVPQREVPWDQVDSEVKERLVAEIRCGDAKSPYEFIEHPGRFKKGDPAPTEPMTAIEKKDGKSYRLLGDAYGDWVAWKIPATNVHLPYRVEVEYPDDRPQNFAVYCRNKISYYNASFGNQIDRRGTVWCLNDPRFFPLSGELRTASFICYPQSQYPFLSLELMNLFRGGRRSAVHAIRVYEISDLPCPKIAQPGNERWFGSQTERAALRTLTYYNGFFNGGDAQLFANMYRCRLQRHYGFLRDWYLTYANMIRRMRFAGENFFMCGFWMYSGPEWAGSAFASRSTTHQYDNFALMFAMFEANDMFLLPWIEYCNSDVTRDLNRYTDKEVAEGAPTPLVVGKDGQQGVTTGSGSSAYNPFCPAVRKDLLDLTRELAGRYGKYKAFKGLAFISGGLFQPSLYMPPRALSWNEMLDWGWEDETIRLFETAAGVKVPVPFDDPQRFGKRREWVLQNARQAWLDFRTRGITDLHQAIADEIKKLAPQADYYPFLGTAGDSLMKAVVMENQDFAESLEHVGFDPEAYKKSPSIHLGWDFFPESFGTANGLKPGLCTTFNNLPAVNDLLDDGDKSACFLNVIWQEPDYGNYLHTNWLWTGDTQNNPNPWFSGPAYASPFADRLSRTTPGVLGFVFTDGMLYTAQNSARRPVGVAFQAIPPGEYRTLEGNNLDRNIVIREAADKAKRVFYTVNPAWWNAETRIRLSGEARLKDLVNDTPVTAGGGILKLKLAPYAIRVFEAPTNVTVVSAETEVGPEAKAWMQARIVDRLAYLDRLGINQTLRRFALPEPLDITITRLGYLRYLFQDGEYLKAQQLMRHPWVIRILDFIEEKQKIDAAGGPDIRTTYRVNVGSDKPYRDSKGQEWLPDQDFNYGAASYGFIRSEPGAAIYRGSKAEVQGPDPEIYRSERSRHFGHAFRVPPGSYTVKIHYAEMFRYRPDQEATDSGVIINGKEAYPAFNLGKEAGGKAMPLVKTVAGVKPVDGVIEIEFADKKGSGRCQGIEVIREQ